ncbi:MAG: restriction endonuclease [Sporichthyaceae bacterium]
MGPEDLPAYSDLILPVLRAVDSLGGSATAGEIVEQVLSALDPSDEALAVTFPNRPTQSVLVDRIMWARSYAKLIGGLESPKRAVFLLTALGKDLLSLPEDEGLRRTYELDREFRRNRPQRRKSPSPGPEPLDLEDPSSQGPPDDDGLPTPVVRWQDDLLARLHRLAKSEDFEDFVMFLLRQYDMRLERVGKAGDRGVDGIGFAPINAVMSSRIAVQVKQYDPTGKPISREAVSLFQNDAKKRGAERAIFVTLGRFSKAAKEEAVSGTPTVDLVDGERLAELVLERRLGVSLQPVVDPAWFDRFDSSSG